jgi:hypothetical protein
MFAGEKSEGLAEETFCTRLRRKRAPVSFQEGDIDSFEGGMIAKGRYRKGDCKEIMYNEEGYEKYKKR